METLKEKTAIKKMIGISGLVIYPSDIEVLDMLGLYHKEINNLLATGMIEKKELDDDLIVYKITENGIRLFNDVDHEKHVSKNKKTI